MYKNASISCALLLALCYSVIDPALAATPDAGVLFAKHCASCHGADRLGGMGPVLLPESLQRTKRDDAVGTIASGRPATQMPAFKDTLTPVEIEALVDYIYTAPATPPVWGEAEINASRDRSRAMPRRSSRSTAPIP